MQTDFWLVSLIAVYLLVYLVYMAVHLEKYNVTQLVLMALVSGVALKLAYNLYLIR